MSDKKKKDGGINIDLGLGGLFNGIEKLVDLAGKLQDAGGEINKEGSIDLDGLKKGMKGVYGFSVKNATGGKTVVEPFGNIKKTPKDLKLKKFGNLLQMFLMKKTKLWLLLKCRVSVRKTLNWNLKAIF